MEQDAARWRRLLASLTELGPPDVAEERSYRTIGFTPADIPALVELARKWAEVDDLELADHDPAFASLHAWAAIAELGDPVIVRVVLEQFPRLQAQADGRFMDEFCNACALLGRAAVAELRDHALDRRHGEELDALDVREAVGLGSLGLVRARAQVDAAAHDAERPRLDELRPDGFGRWVPGERVLDRSCLRRHVKRTVVKIAGSMRVPSVGAHEIALRGGRSLLRTHCSANVELPTQQLFSPDRGAEREQRRGAKLDEAVLNGDASTKTESGAVLDRLAAAA